MGADSSKVFEKTSRYAEKGGKLLKSQFETNYPRCILFNLDDTLILPRHRPVDPYLHAVASTLGHTPTHGIPDITLGGKSDYEIVDSILTKCSVSARPPEIRQVLDTIPSIIEKGVQSDLYQWKPLPGVPRLLQSMYSRYDCVIGLWTGNEVLSAGLKIEAAGLSPKFFQQLVAGQPEPFGCFGSDHQSRLEMFNFAVERYVKFLVVDESVLSTEDMLAVGNCPEHIAQAHHWDIPIVAVATSDYSPKQLAQAEYVFENFEEMNAVVGRLICTHRETGDESAKVTYK